jgi:hypothetical protein
LIFGRCGICKFPVPQAHDVVFFIHQYIPSSKIIAEQSEIVFPWGRYKAGCKLPKTAKGLELLALLSSRDATNYLLMVLGYIR